MRNSEVSADEFTVTDNVNAIIFDFIFGTDEFNEQEINDIAVVFVDGTNFALFPDDLILHFDIGSNKFNFFNNTGGALVSSMTVFRSPMSLSGC